MTSFTKITEQPSPYRHLEKMSVAEVLTHINEEDKKVPYVIEKVIPQIEKLVVVAVDKMLAGGRLFYIRDGSSEGLPYKMLAMPSTYGCRLW